ncbi:MAG: FliM/FliN family flagellar motor switch protein [Myxococcota bacterium]|nr:FliM/FliN family flagellar motor switch protein [Myxococcota bacterium]
MADILSQEELDALLAQMKDGDDDDDADGAEGESGGQPALEDALASGKYSEEMPISDGADTGNASPSTGKNIDMLLNLPVEVKVEVGRAKVPIVDLLNFCQGSVVELDQLASELINLTVNNKVVAQGEAVVINENFGMRVLEVDSVRDRIKKL